MRTFKDNLLKAFEEKAKEVVRYRQFAHYARRDKSYQAERLFKAASEAASTTAFNHLMACCFDDANVRDNLREAMAAASNDAEHVYPEMLDKAKSKDDKSAEWALTYGIIAADIHVKLYKMMLENFEKLQGENFPYFVCSGCANIMEREAPEKCPVCGMTKSKFKRID